jgi:hypothetical protein
MPKGHSEAVHGKMKLVQFTEDSRGEMSISERACLSAISLRTPYYRAQRSIFAASAFAELSHAMIRSAQFVLRCCSSRNGSKTYPRRERFSYALYAPKSRALYHHFSKRRIKRHVPQSRYPSSAPAHLLMVEHRAVRLPPALETREGRSRHSGVADSPRRRPRSRSAMPGMRYAMGKEQKAGGPCASRRRNHRAPPGVRCILWRAPPASRQGWPRATEAERNAIALHRQRCVFSPHAVQVLERTAPCAVHRAGGSG